MARKIDSNLFDFVEDKSKTAQRCPTCQSQLIIKKTSRGVFYACEAYPTCKFTKSLHADKAQIIKQLDVNCPACSEPLVLRQGRFGMYISCLQYPACSYTQASVQVSAADVVQVSLPACPQCQSGVLQQKQSRFGSHFYGCSCFPSCKFAVNYQPVAGVCAHCQFPLLL
ncbi:MAG: DNA topoisomerase family protein, partial [Vibrionaceae bacterium]